uniref:Uncharacterized protein n=1 Tax=Amphiprion percula TaxID=161767 RepID=A0A3P8RZX6_AMPPE
ISVLNFFLIKTVAVRVCAHVRFPASLSSSLLCYTQSLKECQVDFFIPACVLMWRRPGHLLLLLFH